MRVTEAQSERNRNKVLLGEDHIEKDKGCLKVRLNRETGGTAPRWFAHQQGGHIGPPLRVLPFMRLWRSPGLGGLADLTKPQTHSGGDQRQGEQDEGEQ